MNTTPSTFVLVALLATATPAAADVAGPPSGGDEVVSLCDPGQSEGESCETGEGEEGTCSGEAESCYDPTKTVFTKCQVCEEDCSVGPGPRPGGGVGAFVGLGAVGVALLAGRRLRRPRRTTR